MPKRRVKLLNLLRYLIISWIFSGFLTGCGSNSSTSASTKPLAVYKFSATVSHVGTNFFLPITTGDAISGSFSYLPDEAFSNTTSARAIYRQKSPAFIQIDLGTITLNADLNTKPDGTGGYNIEIHNDSVAGQSVDALYFFAADAQLAESYGLASIGMSFSFLDSTHSAINNANLLGDIDINKFDAHTLNIFGSNDIQSLTAAQITSLTRIQ
jgi:hypothetical protein